MFKILPATEKDASEMLKFYRPYVLETAISFQTIPPTVEEFQKRILETSKSFPWIVCELNRKIVISIPVSSLLSITNFNVSLKNVRHSVKAAKP